jgi:hypothetical protein
MVRNLTRDPIYRRRRFQSEVIELCVRWYLTYRLSYRDLVEMMAERGIIISHSTILRWVQRYVEAVEGTGALKPLITLLPTSAAAAPNATSLVTGSVVAVLCNLINNLPMGLIAGSIASGAQLSPHVTGALLIGVDPIRR